MEKRDKADQLIGSISGIEPLEEVPTDVSLRFHETLARLSSMEQKAEKKKMLFSGSAQFALAASFVLVFGLGAVLNFTSEGTAPSELSIVQTQPSEDGQKNNVEDDKIQYSGGTNAIPKNSDFGIKISNSLHAYDEIPMDFYKKIGVGTTWNKIFRLSKENQDCLKSLELDKVTNLIDSGSLSGKSIKAIWSPVTGSSWNVYLVDNQCVAIEKKYVKQ